MGQATALASANIFDLYADLAAVHKAGRRQKTGYHQSPCPGKVDNLEA